MGYNSTDLQQTHKIQVHTTSALIQYLLMLMKYLKIKLK